MITSNIYEVAEGLISKAFKISLTEGAEYEDVLDYYVRNLLPAPIAQALFSHLNGKSGKERTNALIKITGAALALAWDSDEPEEEQEGEK